MALAEAPRCGSRSATGRRTAGAPEAAPGLHDGQAEALRDIFEGLLGGQAAGPQEFLDGPVAIAEIADKIDDAVRVGVPEAHPYFGVVDLAFRVRLLAGGHVRLLLA